MAGGISDNDDEGISGINVTPLVDIMLVLLIVFMVTATFIANKALDLKLPEAESSAPIDPNDKPMSFALDKEGKLYLDSNVITLDEVAGKIAEAKAKRPGTALSAVIAADQTTPYALVIKVIDVIRKNQIVDFALTTDPVPAPGAAPAAAPAAK
ncbi:MAG: biopolymer transporter ExbD [Chitinophagaceae bacterium]|nr:biopolymer transporter ExbD [Oligoflexus sp.]